MNERFHFKKTSIRWHVVSSTGIIMTKRSYDGTEDDRFDVKSQTPDGSESSSTIYVVVPQRGTPEFTQMVR